MEQLAAMRPVDRDVAVDGDQVDGDQVGGHQRAEDPAVDRVPSVGPGQAKELPLRQRWPDTATAQAGALHRLLTINDRQWHDLKGQPCRRAAEQLAGALVQLLAGDGPNAGLTSDGRQRAVALTRSALAWLEGDLKDPGCPSHGR